jgi:hypothetical protein
MMLNWMTAQMSDDEVFRINKKLDVSAESIEIVDHFQ